MSLYGMILSIVSNIYAILATNSKTDCSSPRPQLSSACTTNCMLRFLRSL